MRVTSIKAIYRIGYVIGLLLLMSNGLAATPRLIPFQGHLTRPKPASNPVTYEPVPDGKNSILFTLYTSPAGGESKVWGPERHQDVIVVNGLVNVLIGSVNDLNLSATLVAQALYVGITIDADNNPATTDLELVPRQVMLPGHYAHEAGHAASASNADLFDGIDSPALLVDAAQTANPKVKRAANADSADALAGGIVNVNVANRNVGMGTTGGNLGNIDIRANGGSIDGGGSGLVLKGDGGPGGFAVRLSNYASYTNVHHGLRATGDPTGGVGVYAIRGGSADLDAPTLNASNSGLVAKGQTGLKAYADDRVNGYSANLYGQFGLFDSSGVERVKMATDGTIWAHGAVYPGGFDVAEGFSVFENDNVEPGTVLSIDEVHPGKLKISDQEYDKKVAGIVSGAGDLRAGLILHQEHSTAGKTIVAMSGRVWCKADATSGAIASGDLLTTSKIAGHAMRADDSRGNARGVIIGKAMTELKDGSGLVLVLVNLQ